MCSYVLFNVIFYKFKSRIYLVGISQSRCYSFCQIVICSSLSDSNNPLILIMNPHTAVNHTGNTLERILANVGIFRVFRNKIQTVCLYEGKLSPSIYYIFRIWMLASTLRIMESFILFKYPGWLLRLNNEYILPRPSP